MSDLETAVSEQASPPRLCMEAGSVLGGGRSLVGTGYLLDVILVFDKTTLQNYNLLERFRCVDALSLGMIPSEPLAWDERGRRLLVGT